MNRILFLFSLIIYTSPNYASEVHVKNPSYRDVTLINNQYYQEKHLQLKKPIPATQKKEVPPGRFFYPYEEILPEEMRNIITYFATNGTSAKTLKEATQTTRTLLGTNKELYTFINKPLFSDNLIKDLAIKYHCSHETVAKSLRTKQSKQRLTLQYKLKQICCLEEDNKLLPQLNKLVSDGVDLEFTYNHQAYQKTPLMMTLSYDNNMFEYLLDQGANINGTNSLRVSALQLAASDPINENYCIQLITHPKIEINQQNNRGETAFLYCLTRTNNKQTNRALARILRELLKAGANPKCSDKKGLTPLKAAQQLRKTRTIINIIKQAISPKKAPKL